MSTPVITISSRIPHEPYYFYDQFLTSCARKNISPIFLNGEWLGLMSKPKLLLAHLGREGANYEHVIVSDSWDVIFSGGVDEIISKFKNFNVPIVFNAERACFPRTDLVDRFPERTTPYRFLNSGFIVGQTEAVIYMLRDMKLADIPNDFQDKDGKWAHFNDQETYQLFYLDHLNKAELDSKATICQTLHLSEPDEFYVDAGRVTSRITGNQPAAFHGNGGGKEWLKKIIGILGL